MPATLILDTVDGTEFDVQVGAPQFVRGALVTGVSGDPATANEQVLDALAAAGFYLGKASAIGSQTAYLERTAGKSVSSDSYRVQLFFNQQAGGTPTSYVITTRSYLQPYQNNRLPGTRIALTVPKWVGPAVNPPGDDGGETTASAPPVVPADNAMATFQYPMREVTVSGVKTGAPPVNDPYGSSIGYANVETWLGLPPGYWMISGGTCSDSKYQSLYSYNLSAITKNVEDHSEVFTLRHDRLNIYVKVDSAVENRVLGADYAYGVIDSGPGILRVGPFRVKSFTSLFGFSSLNPPANNQYLGGPGTGGNFV